MAGFHTWAAAAALAALGSAVPAQAQAQARCWEDREVAAAQVRDMQTLLMVAALRCRAAHIDISADYDGFVTAQKASIDQADLVIKQHFAQAGGAQADYDHFATSLANGFGDNETTEASCAEASALAREASMTVPTALGPMAMARVFPAMLPGGHCTAPAGGPTLAAAAPAAAAKPEALPPMIALAAPELVAQPVTLPADVVAAMTVMARFQASQSGHASTAPVLAAASPPAFVSAPLPAQAPIDAAEADEAPAMAPVQTWPVVTGPVYAPMQFAAYQR